MSRALDRAAFLRESGALVITFAIGAVAAGAQTSAPIQANKVGGPAPSEIDSWLAVDANGSVSAYVGKVELGTGIMTAFTQLVADELDVAPRSIRIIEGITGTTPDQGVTSGSQSIQSGSLPLRRAAAQARATLIELAAARMNLAPADLMARDGVIYPRGGDRAKGIAYGALIAGGKFNRGVDPNVVLKAASAMRVVGTSLARVDLPAKAFGTFDYIQNVRVPGMWHARVIRPKAAGATFIAYDDASLHDIMTFRIVRKGNFLAVAAPTEWEAIRAAKALAVTWSGGGLPPQAQLSAIVRATPGDAKIAAQSGDVDAALASASATIAAKYTWPFQTHGSIGPSCAVADVKAESAVIWSGTQGVYPLRAALAGLLDLPEASIRVNYVEASGCYGHNGADDAAADAALISQHMQQPVRVQWSRADEHGWDPKGPAMVMELEGALRADRSGVAAWRNDVYTPTHSTRPNNDAGNLLAGQLLGLTPKITRANGGDRNAPISYTVPNQRVTVHWQSGAVLRPSALRGLGGAQNTFANESFIDELAHAAGADPVAFRRAHLSDPRALAVVDAAATLAKWVNDRTPGKPSGAVLRGRGFAFAQYEVRNAYVAAVVDLEIVRASGAVRLRDVYVAHDCGLIVNPDGLRNQIEGNVIQAASRALKEEVRFDRAGVTSLDWQSYPILRFPEIPDVHLTLIDRPTEPPLGAGEATTCVIAPAIANAIFAASGARLRDVPFTPGRIKQAIS